MIDESQAWSPEGEDGGGGGERMKEMASVGLRRDMAEYKRTGVGRGGFLTVTLRPGAGLVSPRGRSRFG